MKSVLKFAGFTKNQIVFWMPEDPFLRTELIAGFNKILKDPRRVVMCTFDKIRKRISTGRKSQNSHIWGHITQIARETGNDIDDVELTAKVRAVKRGYPCKASKMGNGLLLKHINQLDTQEASYLIETLHEIAAEHNVTLIESEPEGYF